MDSQQRNTIAIWNLIPKVVENQYSSASESDVYHIISARAIFGKIGNCRWKLILKSLLMISAKVLKKWLMRNVCFPAYQENPL
jgi:hypothetical protein